VVRIGSNILENQANDAEGQVWRTAGFVTKEKRDSVLISTLEKLERGKKERTKSSLEDYCGDGGPIRT